MTAGEAWRQTVAGRMARITGLFAVLYGFGVAFGEPLWGRGFAGTWLLVGGLIVGLAFAGFILGPFVRRLMATDER